MLYMAIFTLLAWEKGNVGATTETFIVRNDL